MDERGRNEAPGQPFDNGATSPLREVARFGQSYWLDDLSRPMIESGELRRRVEEEGLTGVTVNPSIFRAAVDATDAYDARIKQLATRPAGAIYEALLVADVSDACDVLRPVYDRTEGRDGFVSLEVSPHLARNAEASIAEAQRFWQAVARRNLFIKIPGTVEGVTAIEALLSAGINVNITLLFAVDRYRDVAEAYLRALERRNGAHQSLASVASVASFFLSRIDTAVDEQLQRKIAGGMPQAERLLGKCAIANARLAYRDFRARSSSARWRLNWRARARARSACCGPARARKIWPTTT